MEDILNPCSGVPSLGHLHPNLQDYVVVKGPAVQQ